MDTGSIKKGMADYPKLLANIKKPPDELYFLGDKTIFRQPGVAIVGTRKATPQGLEYAHTIAKELAGAGLVIVSGLAQGIDGAAHKGALDAKGKTIAVLASSLEESLIFPKNHLALARSIIALGGTLLSEYERNVPALKRHFVARNRIVSGLSLGVVVIESPLKGGSLITAQFAKTQGRPVFALPGSPSFHNTKGTNALIKQGAYLIENAADILAILERRQLFIASGQTALSLGKGVVLKNLEEAKVVKALGEGANDIDKLAKHTKVEIGKLFTLLMGMEVKGIIKETGGRYILVH